MRSLLSYKCSVYGVHIKPFTIAHSQAGMGSFANQDLTEGEVVGYYDGTLVYQFIINALNARGVHGEGVMALTREQLHSLVIRLAKHVSSSDRILHTFWLVPARFACLRIMNDPRSLFGKVVPPHKRPREAGSENFTFADNGTERPDHTKLDAVAVRATRNTIPEEELFVDYGEHYEFTWIYKW